MKKVYLILSLVAVVLSSSAFAASFTGFNTQMSVPTVKDVVMVTVTGNMNTVTGIASVNYTVNTNYDGWVLTASGPGLWNATQKHAIGLSLATANQGAAPGAYTTLVSGNSVTLVNGGAYTGTPTGFDLYMKASSTAFKAGYYGAYINLQFTDSF